MRHPVVVVDSRLKVNAIGRENTLGWRWNGDKKTSCSLCALWFKKV